MAPFTPKALMLAASLLAVSCDSGTDEGSSLPAPANLTISYIGSATSWHYTFGFNAVESAESYLIYYSQTDDHTTASSLASGQFPPVSWTYSRANSYNGQTYYFWVRAYDGESYGAWSASVPSILE